MLSPMQKAAIRHLVVYQNSPPDARMTHAEWCKLPGMPSIRALQKWQAEHEEFQAALAASLKEAEETKDAFASCSRAWALEQLHLLYKQADSAAEKRHALKAILDETRHVADTGETVDFSDLTDEDLAALCLNRGVSVLGMTENELAALAAKGDSL